MLQLFIRIRKTVSNTPPHSILLIWQSFFLMLKKKRKTYSAKALRILFRESEYFTKPNILQMLWFCDKIAFYFFIQRECLNHGPLTFSFYASICRNHICVTATENQKKNSNSWCRIFFFPSLCLYRKVHTLEISGDQFIFKNIFSPKIWHYQIGLQITIG